MPALVRIEYVRPRLGGDLGLSTEVIFEAAYSDATGEVVPAEILTVGAATLSTPAPTFKSDSKGLDGGVFARFTCLSGATVISEAAAAPPPVNDLTGVRQEVGQASILRPVQAGHRFSLVEAAARARSMSRVQLLTNASASSGEFSGIRPGWFIWRMQGTFGGATAVLREKGPDGVNWIDLETMTAPGRKGVAIGEDTTVRLFILGGAPANLYSDLI